MALNLYLDKMGGNTVGALADGTRLIEYHVEKIKKNQIVGSIFKGRVQNVLNGMQAAFIDIGMEKNAFISVKDAVPKVDVVKEEQIIDFKISKIVKPNSNLLVQVKKMPTAEKGARVSTHITLPGNYIVLMPNFEVVTVSQKISSDAEKDRLIGIIKNIIPSGFGVIIRTDAEYVSCNSPRDG